MGYIKKKYIVESDIRKGERGEIYICPYCKSDRIANKYNSKEEKRILFCTNCLQIFTYKNEKGLKFLEINQ